MELSDLQNLLKRYGLRPNFTYGQNFLLDDEVLDQMLAVAKISKTDAVLEIGPGIGNLTRLLCAQAEFVLAVEKDPSMLPILKTIKKDSKNFQYEIADILEFNYLEHFQQHLGQASDFSYKVVANIPYYITGKILQLLLNSKNKPKSITLLTQKEVAQSICAKAGDLSVLAISVQLFGEPKIKAIVPAESFFPAPKVQSAILHIELFKKPEFDLKDEKEFFKVLKACFAGKRKQIHNTLKNNLRLSNEQVTEALGFAKINPAARPQDLEISQWLALSEKIGSYKN